MDSGISQIPNMLEQGFSNWGAPARVKGGARIN